MDYRMTRRDLLAAASAAGIALSTTSLLQAQEFKTKLCKAVIVGKPDEKTLEKLKAAGYDGVEASPCPVDQAAKCREVAEKVGMKIHSVLRGWANFNGPAGADNGMKATEDALRAAAGYGAGAVLLVPCRIGPSKENPMPMPQALEFKIEFDDKTGHVIKVAEGDNDKYEAYIKAHNHAIDTSTEAVKKLIPLAEELKVVIALENVWNNLWVQPAIFAHFVKSFNNPWVKGYFDIGNHVKYAPSEQWVKALGSNLCRCHAKDFKLKADGHGGDWANIRDGSVNWPAVRPAMEDVNFNSFLTIEGGSCSLEEHSKRLDLILAGK